MKSFIAFLITLLVITSIDAHDLQVARFEISHLGGTDYSLTVKMDRNDLVKAISEGSDQSLSIKQQIFNYINHNFNLRFNSNNVVLNLQNIIYEKEMIFVDGKLKTEVSSVQLVEITNTCLPNVEGQNNIVEFSLYNKTRSFRLTSERTETKFSYD